MFELNLTFNSKAISVNLHLRCHPYIIPNYCANYEHPPLKRAKGVHVKSRQTDQKCILP